VLSLKGRHEARGLRVVSVSSYEGDDPEEAKRLISYAGFRLEQVELIEQDNEKATFLWIAARKS